MSVRTEGPSRMGLLYLTLSASLHDKHKPHSILFIVLLSFFLLLCCVQLNSVQLCYLSLHAEWSVAQTNEPYLVNIQLFSVPVYSPMPVQIQMSSFSVENFAQKDIID